MDRGERVDRDRGEGDIERSIDLFPNTIPATPSSCLSSSGVFDGGIADNKGPSKGYPPIAFSLDASEPVSVFLRLSKSVLREAHRSVIAAIVSVSLSGPGGV